MEKEGADLLNALSVKQFYDPPLSPPNVNNRHHDRRAYPPPTARGVENDSVMFADPREPARSCIPLRDCIRGNEPESPIHSQHIKGASVEVGCEINVAIGSRMNQNNPFSIIF